MSNCSLIPRLIPNFSILHAVAELKTSGGVVIVECPLSQENKGIQGYFPYRSRKGEVSDEIFEMLLSFTDFLTFKQAMLDYKAVSIRILLLLYQLL